MFSKDFHFPMLSPADREGLHLNGGGGRGEIGFLSYGCKQSTWPEWFVPIFFQKNWEVVGPAIFFFIKAAFMNAFFLKEMNET